MQARTLFSISAPFLAEIISSTTVSLLSPKLSDFIIKNQALSAEILYFIRKKTIQLIKTYLTERVRNVKEKI